MDILRDVRKDVARFVGSSGACPDDASVVEAINTARRVLYPLGDWRDTVDLIAVCCYAGYITLPSDYQHLKAVRTCNNSVVVSNEWFTKLEGSLDDYCGDTAALTLVGGSYVTFRDWPLHCRACATHGFYVRLVHESEKDCGVELVFNGRGMQQSHLSLTRTLSGPWIDNDARPGEQPLESLNYLVKPVTHGRIRMYGYDGANTILMAIYEPHEINPQYTRYRGMYMRQSTKMVAGKAKKRYIPITVDTEPVDIHTDALIHALQALTDREARNIAGYTANIKLAVNFLQTELSGPQSTAVQPMQMSSAYRVEGLIY